MTASSRKLSVMAAVCCTLTSTCSTWKLAPVRGSPKLNSGITENEAIFRGGAYYKWLFSETAEFRQDLTTEAGSSNTYLESVSAISAKLLGNLALVASYTIKNNSDVPALTEKTDTYTALSLEYLF